jgi:hypothetical protein
MLLIELSLPIFCLELVPSIGQLNISLNLLNQNYSFVTLRIVRNNHAMDMSLCHGGVLVEHECVCESRRVRVRHVGACRTIVESGRERLFVPPQPLVVWG